MQHQGAEGWQEGPNHKTPIQRVAESDPLNAYLERGFWDWKYYVIKTTGKSCLVFSPLEFHIVESTVKLC